MFTANSLLLNYILIFLKIYGQIVLLEVGKIFDFQLKRGRKKIKSQHIKWLAI